MRTEIVKKKIFPIFVLIDIFWCDFSRYCFLGSRCAFNSWPIGIKVTLGLVVGLALRLLSLGLVLGLDLGLHLGLPGKVLWFHSFPPGSPSVLGFGFRVRVLHGMDRRPTARRACYLFYCHIFMWRWGWRKWVGSFRLPIPFPGNFSNDFLAKTSGMQKLWKVYTTRFSKQISLPHRLNTGTHTKICLFLFGHNIYVLCIILLRITYYFTFFWTSDLSERVL